MNEYDTHSIDQHLELDKMVVMKLQGPKKEVIEILHNLPKIIAESRMNISPILPNAADKNVHCFVNISIPPEPVQSLQEESTNDGSQG